MAAALVGVLWPLRHVVSRALVDGVVAEGRRRRWTTVRIGVGLLCLAFTAVIPIVHGEGEVVGNVVLVAALVCLLPPLFDGLVALFDRVQRSLGTVASALAVIELRTPQTSVRSLAIAATAAIAVFGTVEFQGVQRNLTNGLRRGRARHRLKRERVGHAQRGSRRVRHDPVQGCPLARSGSPARRGGGRPLSWWLPGLGAASSLGVGAARQRPCSRFHRSQLVSGDPALASMRIRQGGWAVLSQALAGEHHLRLGDAFVLPAPRPIVLRVAAISNNLGWPPGAMIVSAVDYARAWESGDPSAYEIQIKPNTTSRGGAV